MAYPVSLTSKRRESERLMRFAVVGGIGTLIDFGVLYVLKEIVGLPLIVANSLSYLAGVVNNFTLNRSWTFPESRNRAAWRQFMQFLAVSTAGLLLNSLIVVTLAAPLGALLGLSSSGYMAAKVLATGIVVFWNFGANRLWTFRQA